MKRKLNKKRQHMNFRSQLNEDLDLIQRDWKTLDNNIKKREYAFNYWVINRLYSIDEELIPELITEYNDKAIDCYVHYEDSKELYIIQNKYYSENTILDRPLVADFLKTPLVCLNENRYTKSKELQLIFNKAKDDPEYKIFLHFYYTTDKRNLDSDSNIKNFNLNPPITIAPLLNAALFNLDDISRLYYGQSFKENPSFNYTLNTKVRGNTLRILPKEYEMPEMSETYYMLTPVAQLYYMYSEAKAKKYELFEDNIREYLGSSVINKGIMETLKSKSDRSNFFYYNNGVTMICNKVETPTKHSIKVIKPQVINGCQTVNSIYQVLAGFTSEEIEKEFNQVFVMVKVLVFDEIKPSFYRDVVKYTNKQNFINENAFGAKTHLFSKIQKGLKERGFLLLVKPSDKHILTTSHSSDKDTNELLELANKFSNKIGLNLTSLSDLFIPIDKLLQVYLAFITDGYKAYTKKNAVLKVGSEIYKDYSLKIDSYLSFDNIIRLYLIYTKAENEKIKSGEAKNPIPYYLIGFLGYFIKNKEKYNDALKRLFEENNDVFPDLYLYLSKLTSQYKKFFLAKTNEEYNAMIKKPIDIKLLDEQIETLNDLILPDKLKSYFNSLL